MSQTSWPAFVEDASTAPCIVVVPCYNEQHRLQTAEFAAFVEQQANISFVFVNDGSSDGTMDLLEDLVAQHPGRMAVLDKQPNGGKAEAVRAGMLMAMAHPGTAYVGFWDADLATPLSAIQQLLDCFALDPMLLMVFGARVRLLGRHIYRRTLRHYLGRIFATVVSKLLRLQIYDTQCGAKIFRVNSELGVVLEKPFFSRWIFDVELLARFIDYHHGDTDPVFRSIYEFPLEKWTDVAGSKVGAVDFLKAAGELLHIYLRYVVNSARSSPQSSQD